MWRVVLRKKRKGDGKRMMVLGRIMDKVNGSKGGAPQNRKGD